jgi:hypothetical protein
MRKFKVNIWHANSNDGLFSAYIIGSSARSPAFDITLSHTLRHTLEMETEDYLAACSNALGKAIAAYPRLPELDPGHVRVSVWNEDRRTGANDIFIVFDLDSDVCEGEFLYCGECDSDNFVKVQMLEASLSGHTVH